jgi:alkylation response protein AidB-like acyl-CoA dehydrogenase
MDFTPSAEQQMLSDSVARFIEKDYPFEARMELVRARQGGSGCNWRAFAENGWLSAAVPEDVGGIGGSAIETAIICQQFGRGLVIEPYLGSAIFAMQTLIAAASTAQRDAWLPSLLGGARRLAVAYSEPASRGLPGIVATRATDGRLHGRKTLVLGGAGADALIVSAHDKGEIQLFLVGVDQPSVTVTPVILHDGSLAAEVILDGAEAQRTPGRLPALEQGLAHALLGLCADLVGAMEKSIELTAAYLRTRHQFGVPIASFQSLQHRMADMTAEMELARSMLFAALNSFENDNVRARRETLSAAKALITTSARNVCGQAIQLHGGIGMTEECSVGHFFKRAVVADALFGGRTVHEAICADALRAEMTRAA